MRAAHSVYAFRNLVVSLLACAFFSSRAAAIVVEPGESSGPLTASGCSSGSGNALPTGTIDCLRCFANCDEVTDNKANAGIIFVILPPPGRFFAFSAPYVDFTVGSTATTADNLLPASINYDIEWSGLWVLLGVFADVGPPSEVMITLTLVDRTENNRIVRSELVHHMTPNLTSIDIQGIPLDIGGWTDTDRVKNSFMAMLKRGHDYRLVMRLDLKAFSLANRNTNLDYTTGDKGAWWNALSVSVAEDPEELVANHGHTYLTGRGEGHNNTEATTSAAIFFDDGTTQGPNGGVAAASTPVLSRIMPNPSDPDDPKMTIAFTLKEATHVRIKIFDVAGKEVLTLVDAMRAAGDQLFPIDAQALPAGVYLYRLEAGPIVESRKLVVVR